MDELHEKYNRLKASIAGYGSVAIAFSGGVDSTFLLQAAHEVLGDQAIAVTAAPIFVPSRELQKAQAFCRERGIRQNVISAEDLNRTIRRTAAITAKKRSLVKFWRLLSGKALPQLPKAPIWTISVITGRG